MPDTLVLAFDGDCGRCRRIAGAVAGRGLEVLPLRDYRVTEWRSEALGPDAPWAPTLLAIDHDGDGDAIRAWCGPRLVPALVAFLGPRRALAVAGAVARSLRTPSPGRAA